MKASFVVTLLALCLTAGAVELPHLGKALSFPNYSSVLTAALDPKDGQVSNPVSKQNTGHFYPVIEHGYYRSGITAVYHYRISIEQCIKYCLNSIYGCVAVSYYYSTGECQEKKTLGSLSTNPLSSTVLVNYRTGVDPCDSSFMLSGYTRWYFYYKYFPSGETPTVKDCCIKCKQDPESRCKAWRYYTSDRTCYLLDGTGPLSASTVGCPFGCFPLRGPYARLVHFYNRTHLRVVHRTSPSVPSTKSASRRPPDRRPNGIEPPTSCSTNIQTATFPPTGTASTGCITGYAVVS